MSSILDNSVVHSFGQFLFSTKPRPSDAEQNPESFTCTILPGSYLKAYRLMILELGSVERRKLERHHTASAY